MSNICAKKYPIINDAKKYNQTYSSTLNKLTFVFVKSNIKPKQINIIAKKEKNKPCLIFFQYRFLKTKNHILILCKRFLIDIIEILLFNGHFLIKRIV